MNNKYKVIFAASVMLVDYARYITYRIQKDAVGKSTFRYFKVKTSSDIKTADAGMVKQKTIFGFSLYGFDTDTAIIPEIKRDGYFDCATTKLMTYFIKPGDTVLDIGANIGYNTMLAARLSGDKGHVYSFEAMPSTYKMLMKGVHDSVGNITTFNIGVFNTERKIAIYHKPSNPGAQSIGTEAGFAGIKDKLNEGEVGEIISTVRLDDILRPIVKEVDFIKIDIEGSEGCAFQGMNEVLGNSPKVILAMEYTPCKLFDDCNTIDVMSSLFKNNGYQAYLAGCTDVAGNVAALTINKIAWEDLFAIKLQLITVIITKLKLVTSKTESAEISKVDLQTTLFDREELFDYVGANNATSVTTNKVQKFLNLYKRTATEADIIKSKFPPKIFSPKIICLDIYKCQQNSEFKNEAYAENSKLWNQAGVETTNFTLKENNIPLLFHMIYFTNYASKKEISTGVMDTFIKNKEILGDGWECLLWTYNEEYIPNTINFFKQNNCKINNIASLVDNSMLLSIIKQQINLSIFAGASDLVRLLAIKKYGGLYLDMDQAFVSSPEFLHNFLDLYIGFTGSDNWLGNGVIAAKPEHFLINKLFEHVYSVYGIKIEQNLPMLPQMVSPCMGAITNTAGPVAYTTYFSAYSNAQGNQDIAFHDSMLLSAGEYKTVLMVEGNYIEVPKLGKHLYENANWFLCDKTVGYLNLRDYLLVSPEDINTCSQTQQQFGITHAMKKIKASQADEICNKSAIIPYIRHFILDISKIDDHNYIHDIVTEVSRLSDCGTSFKHIIWAENLEPVNSNVTEAFSNYSVAFKVFSELYENNETLKNIVRDVTISSNIKKAIVISAILDIYGGIYAENNFLQPCEKIEKLHKCNEAYFMINNAEYIDNAILAISPESKLGDAILSHYMDFVTNDLSRFPNCSTNEREILADTYGYVKPIIAAVLADEISEYGLGLIEM